MNGYISAQITREDVGDACLILTLNERQKEMILEQFPEQKMVYTLSEFTGEPQTHSPYGGELADYGRCFEQLKVMVDKMADRLEEEHYL